MNNVFYGSLITILVLPIVWMTAPEMVYRWHPFSEVEYKLSWFLVWAYLYFKPLLYVIAMMNYRGQWIIKLYLVYEIVLIVDWWLFYGQSEFRSIVGTLLGLYTLYQWGSRTT